MKQLENYLKTEKNQIEYKVYGRYALFSDPITRMGGEKCTYMLPTYQALKGVTESIYWKPSILWVLDEVCIMHPICTESKSIRPISYDKQENTLSVYTYLVDPLYLVRAHFIPNPYREEEDLIADGKNTKKHYSIAQRMIERGGRRDIFLGTRECQGYVEPCDFEQESKKSEYYDRAEIDFGVMFHGFDYPDETGKNELGVRFWHPKMQNGIIRFCKPEECGMRKRIRSMKPKKFGGKYANFKGGEFDGLDTGAE